MAAKKLFETMQVSLSASPFPHAIYTIYRIWDIFVNYPSTLHKRTWSVSPYPNDIRRRIVSTPNLVLRHTSNYANVH